VFWTHVHLSAKAVLLEYVGLLKENTQGWLSEMDLDSPESGFSWYPMPKLEHQLVNLRHLGIHIGQLQERLMAAGIEPRWVTTA
jgi:hypothetical protein